MILEVAVLNVRPGQERAFEAAMVEAHPLIAASPGFRGIEVRPAVTPQGRYLLLVHWEKLEDHTEGFRRSDRYERWRTLLHHFYDPMPTVEHYGESLLAAARAYKVCSKQEWQEAVASGSWSGSADDLRDGFIHFSLAHQLEATVRKYFAGRDDLVVVCFDPTTLGPALRYEASRNGDLFPHLYATLDPSLALAVTPLIWRDGNPVLP